MALDDGSDGRMALDDGCHLTRRFRLITCFFMSPANFSIPLFRYSVETVILLE